MFPTTNAWREDIHPDDAEPNGPPGAGCVRGMLREAGVRACRQSLPRPLKMPEGFRDCQKAFQAPGRRDWPRKFLMYVF